MKDALLREGKSLEVLRRRISRAMTKTIAAYDLIRPGDRVMVAISGGKDSYTLLDLLSDAQRRAPFDFSLIAVHLDQSQPGYDGAPLRRWLEASGLEHEILRRDTYSTVIEETPAGKAYCAVCSRLRRGILYGAAERLECGVIALGHHRDDALETLLMNLFYSGRLQAMPAGYTTDNGRFRVVRPLIECAESDIAAYAAAVGYPILPCNLCGSQNGLRREAMAELLERLEGDNPNVRSVMLNALRNVSPTHLLDRELIARVTSASSGDEAPPAREPTGGARRLPVLPS